MKKILFLVVFAISSNFLNAQSKLRLSPNIKLGYPSVFQGTPDEFSTIKGATSTTSGVFLASLGGDLMYQFNEKIGLQVGVNLSVAQYNQNFDGFRWGTDWDPVAGILHKSITKFQLTLVQINTPIIVKYFASSKISYNLGVIPQFILSKKASSKIEYIDNWKPALNNGTVQYPLRKFNPAFYAGVSFYPKLTSKTQLEVSPYAQINMFADDLYLYYAKNRFYQVGVSIGIQKAPAAKPQFKKR